MTSKNNSWLPPVTFYFQVQFHWGSQHVSASFLEVSGLDQEMVIEESDLTGNDGAKIKLPKNVKQGDIILKRPVEPLDDKITKWVNDCFAFTVNGWISPCMLVIFLMNAERQSVACWTCSRAYPVKWGMGAFDAQKSELAVETLTLTYNYLERKK